MSQDQDPLPQILPQGSSSQNRRYPDDDEERRRRGTTNVTNNTTNNTTRNSGNNSSDELAALREQNSELLRMLREQLNKKQEPASQQQAPVNPQKQSKPFYTRPWFVITASIVGLATLPYSLGVVAAGLVIAGVAKAYSGIKNWWKKRKEAKAAKKAAKEGKDPQKSQEKSKDLEKSQSKGLDQSKDKDREAGVSRDQEIKALKAQIASLKQAIQELSSGKPANDEIRRMVEPVQPEVKQPLSTRIWENTKKAALWPIKAVPKVVKATGTIIEGAVYGTLAVTVLPIAKAVEGIGWVIGKTGEKLKAAGNWVGDKFKKTPEQSKTTYNDSSSRRSDSMSSARSIDSLISTTTNKTKGLTRDNFPRDSAYSSYSDTNLTRNNPFRDSTLSNNSQNNAGSPSNYHTVRQSNTQDSPYSTNNSNNYPPQPIYDNRHNTSSPKSSVTSTIGSNNSNNSTLHDNRPNTSSPKSSVTSTMGSNNSNNSPLYDNVVPGSRNQLKPDPGMSIRSNLSNDGVTFAHSTTSTMSRSTIERHSTSRRGSSKA